MAHAENVRIELGDGGHVSGLIAAPPRAVACYVVAHGAGAGMTHPFMTSVAAGLAERNVATLRYQFPSMERGSKRPDVPKVAEATVRAAIAAASRAAPALRLVAGGKSFGGRMTSQAQAASPLPGVRGIAFLGFPLHPPGRRGTERARHLCDIRVPMLFLQGARDALADIGLLQPLVAQLGSRATLEVLEDADHSFHVPGRSGRTDAETLAHMLDALAAWIEGVVQ